MRPIYEAMGLNERQITLLSEARQKRHYYVTSPQGNRLIDLSLSPLELAFVGVSSKDDLRRVRQCVTQYGDSWWVEWVKEQGVEE